MDVFTLQTHKTLKERALFSSYQKRNKGIGYEYKKSSVGICIYFLIVTYFGKCMNVTNRNNKKN